MVKTCGVCGISFAVVAVLEASLVGVAVGVIILVAALVGVDVAEASVVVVNGSKLLGRVTFSGGQYTS